MPPSEALAKRLETIPIFKTLRLKIESADHGSAILTAPYDTAYDGVFEPFQADC
jgi:hypothetical protein